MYDAVVGLPIQPITGRRDGAESAERTVSEAGTNRSVSTHVGMVVTAGLKRRA